MRKAKIIWERTGVLIGHDQISALCLLWGTKSPEEFMEKLDNMSNEELRSWLEKLKKKRNALYNYLESEEKIYA
jgi:N-methylhydantoinase B/oxoprolinase/acetone carboxylase alpha subunit